MQSSHRLSVQQVNHSFPSVHAEAGCGKLLKWCKLRTSSVFSPFFSVLAARPPPDGARLRLREPLRAILLEQFAKEHQDCYTQKQLPHVLEGMATFTMYFTVDKPLNLQAQVTKKCMMHVWHSAQGASHKLFV